VKRLFGLFALAAVGAALATAPASAKTQQATRVETVFPAAGQFVVDKVPVRANPSPHAPVIKTLTQFRDDYRIQVVYAVGVKIGTDKRPWYKISIPMRPNGTMGWIPARTAQISPTVAQIDVHRRSRTIDIFSHGSHVWHAIVAIGAPGMETPLGRYSGRRSRTAASACRT
jgi:hypothetical protein